MKQLFTFLYLLLFNSTLLFSQVNAPGSNLPFPQNVKYSHGIMPDSINYNNALESYKLWKNYILDSSCVGYSIDYDGEGDVVSEGIGYAMLLAAYAADKKVFDGLRLFYKNFTDPNGLMNWKIGYDCIVSGYNSATDAEEDVAMALVVAHYQWGDNDTSYIGDAKRQIIKIRQYEVDPIFYRLKPGDSFSSPLDPSYLVPGYYHVFAILTEDTTWNTIADSAYALLAKNANPQTGLVSDWCDTTGVPVNSPGDAYSTSYYYDACRYPWRLASDYLWFGDKRALQLIGKLNNWLKSQGGSSNIVNGYTLSGQKIGAVGNNVFVAPFACGLMLGDTSNKASVNDFAKYINTNSDYFDYYVSALQTLSMFMLTGNFYLPLETINGPSILDSNQAQATYYIANATSPIFKWNITQGATIVSGQGTDSVIIAFNNFISGVITVINGADTLSKTIANPYLQQVTGLVSPNIHSSELVIFPNPSSGIFTVVYPEITSIKIVSVQGKIVYEQAKPENSEKIKIDLSNLDKGVYFIQIISDNEAITNKLVLE